MPATRYTERQPARPVQMAPDELNRGLVLWVPGVDETGSLYHDITDYANAGELLNGAFWNVADCPTGWYGLDLNGLAGGTASRVDIPETRVFDSLSRNNTICCWVFSRSFGQLRYIIDQQFGGRSHFTLLMNEDGFINYRNGNTRLSSSARMFVDEWSFVAVSLDNDVASGYVSGQWDPAFGTFPGETRPWLTKVGVRASDNELAWHGIISDLRIYNRPLSREELDELFEVSQQAYPNQLVRNSIQIPFDVTAGVSFNVNDAVHAHAADSAAISQTHPFSPDSALHGHTAGEPGISQTHIISPDSAAHSHIAESPVISVEGALFFTINDAAHAHTAGEPPVSQTHPFSVDTALHSHATTSAMIYFGDFFPDSAAHSHTATAAQMSLPQIGVPAIWYALRGQESLQLPVRGVDSLFVKLRGDQ